MSSFRVIQEPGQYMITGPAVFHQGFNQRHKIAEAVNFAIPSWKSCLVNTSSCYCLPDIWRVAHCWNLKLSKGKGATGNTKTEQVWFKMDRFEATSRVFREDFLFLLLPTFWGHHRTKKKPYRYQSKNLKLDIESWNTNKIADKDEEGVYEEDDQKEGEHRLHVQGTNPKFFEKALFATLNKLYKVFKELLPTCFIFYHLPKKDKICFLKAPWSLLQKICQQSNWNKVFGLRKLFIVQWTFWQLTILMSDFWNWKVISFFPFINKITLI